MKVMNMGFMPQQLNAKRQGTEPATMPVGEALDALRKLKETMDVHSPEFQNELSKYAGWCNKTIIQMECLLRIPKKS